MSSFSRSCRNVRQSPIVCRVLFLWMPPYLKGPLGHPRQLQSMETTGDQLLLTKREVQLFVFQKSVSDHKPFRVVKSGWNRFVVVCSETGCLFQMSFYQHVDGVYHLCQVNPHTCDAAFPTIKKIWVISKTREFLLDSPVLTVSELKDLFRREHGVNVSSMMIFRSLREIKNDSPLRGLSFGLLSSFLSALEANEGTTTRLERDGDVFQRAFVALRMCVRSFQFTTRVIGLDACHMKGK